jgi:hypothetical protein
MKKEEQAKKPLPTKCLICAAPVEPSAKGAGADYAFCAGHLAALHDTPAQRARLLQVKQDLALRHVAIAVDANGVGWFHHLPPPPVKPQAVRYDVHPRTGELVPRYLDTSSPTGIAWVDGLDIDKRRLGGEEELDDGESYDVSTERMTAAEAVALVEKINRHAPLGTEPETSDDGTD